MSASVSWPSATTCGGRGVCLRRWPRIPTSVSKRERESGISTGRRKPRSLPRAVDRRDLSRVIPNRGLAEFLLGWTLASRGEVSAAIGHTSKPRSTRPGAQSAAVLLAALELQRGDAAKADAIARASFERKTDLIPGGCSSTRTIPACRD